MLNSFWVHHGKGPCYGSAGRVKQRIVNLVKTETVVINNANGFYNACKRHLETTRAEGSCIHYIQEFEFTKKLATRPNTGTWTTVSDTCKLHSITNVVGTNQIKLKDFCASADLVYMEDINLRTKYVQKIGMDLIWS